ncbi:hypothetical protein BD413DRAFT_161451 [Trametes elegans]|nr:hypothetical protein BD413DRAFT_161451 [Trametes elegans]
MMETSEAVRAAAPRHLSLHITSSPRYTSSIVTGTMRYLVPTVEGLGILRASPTLTHLVFTLDCKHVCLGESEQHDNILNDPFRRDVPGLTLNHVLIVYPEIPPHFEHGNQRYRWITGCRHHLALREHVLAELSPTLRWVDVRSRPYGLWAWEVRRGDAQTTPEQPGGPHRAEATLLEMPEDEAWPVVRAEKLVDSCVDSWTTSD